MLYHLTTRNKNNNANICCLVNIIIPRIRYITISKRNMIPWLTKIAQKKSITYTHLYTPKNRQFATAIWSCKTRIEPAAKKFEEKPNIIVTDKKTGFNVMFSKDYSGKNHIMLVDENFVSDEYYLVYGCFTSSSKIIEGITPEKVSKYQFTLKEKTQYFLRYEKARLIQKHLVKQSRLDKYTEVANKKSEKPLTEKQQVAEKEFKQDLRKLYNSITPVPQDLY